MAQIINEQQSEEGFVPLPSSFPTLYSAEHQKNPFEEFTATVSEVWTTGKVALPIAATSPEIKLPFGAPGVKLCKVVQIHQPMAHRIIEWTAVRTGKPPLVPKPIDYDDAELLQGTLTRILPTTKSIGSGLMFTISGKFIYILTDWDGNLPMVTSPVYDLDRSAFEFTEANFYDAFN